MRRTRTTGVLAVAASLALAAVGLTAVIPASAGTPGDPAGPGIQQEGTLTLTTPATGAGEVTFANLPPQAVKTTGSCDLDLATGQKLLKAKGYVGDPSNSKKVGFLNGSIGVNEKVASLCNKVDGQSFNSWGFPKYVPETLELSLGDSLKNFAGDDMYATSASLDIELRASGIPGKKAPATVEATLWNLKGPTPTVSVGTFTLIQVPPPAAPPAPAPAGTTYAQVADNGNVQWEISAAASAQFDTIRLKAVAGDFSLEGGADGGQPTTFNLVSNVDALIPCDDTPLVGNTTTVTFVGNADGTDCTPFGATLTNGSENVGGVEKQFVQFLKPPSINPAAQFILEITWKVENEDGLPSVALRNTEIDFEIPGPDSTFKQLAFCSTFPPAVLGREDPDGSLGILNFEEFNRDDTLENPNPFKDFDTDSPDVKEFACIDTRDAVVTEAEVKVNDVIFVVGDVKPRY